jgi:Glycosyl transferase family, helical bundle domain
MRMRASLSTRNSGPVSPEPYEIVELIRLKRDGGTFERDQIDWLIDAYTREVIAEEQMSALAMAVFFRGLTRAWTVAIFPGRPSTSTRRVASVTRSRCL